MNIIFYIIIFAMGITFGSFLTLSSYRIPLNQDITHTRSYCPNCNHKLSFIDLIPVFSYLFLGEKCRYCHKKISPRYITIEVLTGLSFLILAYVLGLNIYTLTISSLIEFSIGVLYIVFLFLIASINKEHKYIDKRVLIYGIIISFINVIYQYFTVDNFNTNRIIIYYIFILILTIISIKMLKSNEKGNDITNLLILVIIMNLFTSEITMILTIIFTLLIISIGLLMNKILKKHKNSKMPVAYYMVIANVVVLLIAFAEFIFKG